jgi:hypothetical protein
VILLIVVLVDRRPHGWCRSSVGRGGVRVGSGGQDGVDLRGLGGRQNGGIDEEVEFLESELV